MKQKLAKALLYTRAGIATFFFVIALLFMFVGYLVIRPKHLSFLDWVDYIMPI